MNKELWLLRHGKAWADADNDFARGLERQGQEENRLIGEWMLKEGLMPDRVISSPANRAISTAVMVCDVLGIGQDSIVQDGRLYFQGIGILKQVVSENLRSFEQLMLVGHNPDFEDLLADLLGANGHHLSLSMPTSALARIDLQRLDFGLDAGCGDLIGLTYFSWHPKDANGIYL
ncbi:histidine phosphatase family protein [Methylosoma difficile]